MTQENLMHNRIRYQSGYTFITWLLAGVFVTVVLILAVRLVPPYLKSFSVKKSLESLAQETKNHKMSKLKLQELFARRLYVNSVKNVDPKTLEIKNENEGMTFAIKYEIRVHAIGNIDAVLTFHHEAVVE